MAFDFADGYVQAGGDVVVTAKDPAWAPNVELLVNGKIVAVDRKAGYGLTIDPKKYGKRVHRAATRAYDQARSQRTYHR